MSGYDNFKLSRIEYKLLDWENELVIDFEDEQFVVLSGLNASGKTLLLSTIQKISDLLVTNNPRSKLNSNELEFKRVIQETPIEYLYLTLKYNFTGYHSTVETDEHFFSPEFIKQWEPEAWNNLNSQYDSDLEDEVDLDISLSANQLIQLQIRRDENGAILFDYSSVVQVLENSFVNYDLTSGSIIAEIKGPENFNPFSIFPFNRVPLESHIGYWSDLLNSEFTVPGGDKENNYKANSSKIFDFSITRVPRCEIRTPFSHFLDTNREYNFSNYIGDTKLGTIDIIQLPNVLEEVSDKSKRRRLWNETGITDVEFRSQIGLFYSKKKVMQICEMLNSDEVFEAFVERFPHKEKAMKRALPLARKIYIDLFHSNYKNQTILHMMSNLFFNDTEVITKKHHSSGEKNIIVMLIQILNKIEDVDILLIDEPEISMHIGLQRGFIDNLKGFLKGLSGYTNVNVLITTHSPDIIYNNPELVLSIPPDVIS